MTVRPRAYKPMSTHTGYWALALILAALIYWAFTSISRIGIQESAALGASAAAAYGPADHSPLSATPLSAADLAQRHAACQHEYGIAVLKSLPSFERRVRDTVGDVALSSSYGVFYSTTLGNCAGVVMVDQVGKQATMNFVFDAVTRRAADFDTDQGTRVYSEFVRSFAESEASAKD